MKKPASELKDDLRPEYDLRDLLDGATRGKYAKPYAGMVLLASREAAQGNSAQGGAKRNPGSGSFGEESGALVAADAKLGKVLGKTQLNQGWWASPMTYMVGGKQYVSLGVFHVCLGGIERTGGRGSPRLQRIPRSEKFAAANLEAKKAADLRKPLDPRYTLATGLFNPKMSRVETRPCKPRACATGKRTGAEAHPYRPASR